MFFEPSPSLEVVLVISTRARPIVPEDLICAFFPTFANIFMVFEIPSMYTSLPSFPNHGVMASGRFILKGRHITISIVDLW